LTEPLRDYVLHFPELDTATHAVKIKILGFYLQENSPEGTFTTNSLQKIYDELDFVSPANFSVFLSQLVKRETVIRRRSGYRLSKPAADEIQAKLGNLPLVSISSELTRLPALLQGVETAFLQEAIDCLRVNAWRASIILTWILTIDHLEQHVLSKHLQAFNAALAKNNRYTDLTVVAKKDFEDIKESDFIELMRSAGVITNDQRKLLDEKLGVRNSCAHPSNMTFTQSKVTSFLEDIVYNVLTQLA
jgi:hypothetical protein